MKKHLKKWMYAWVGLGVLTILVGTAPTVKAQSLSSFPREGALVAGASGHWSSGFFQPNLPDISFIAEDGEGHLFVSGRFQDFSGVRASLVVMWDGVSWQSLGTGLSGEVNALASDKDDGIIVSGIELIGNAKVAQWDGSQWRAYPTPAIEGPAGFDIPVYYLVTDGQGTPYAYSCSSGTRYGYSATGVVRWDGSAWVRLPEAPPCLNGTLRSDELGGVYAEWEANLRRWDPTRSTWDVVAPLKAGEVDIELFAVRASGTLYGRSYPSNGFTLMRYRDGSWNPVVLPGSATFGQIAFDDDGVAYVLGVLGYVPGVTDGERVLFKETGADWSEIALPAGEIDQIHSGTSVYVTGRLHGSSGDVGAIARLDGSSWSILPMQQGQGAAAGVGGLWTSRAGGIYASGYANEGPVLGQAEGPLARWDGEKWQTIPLQGEFSPVGVVDGRLFGRMEGHPTLLALTGAALASTAFDKAVPCQGAGAYPEGAISRIHRDVDGNYYATGNCAYDRAFVAKWESGWVIIGDVVAPNGGSGAGIAAITSDDAGNVYIGGRFLSAGGKGAQSVARWDGTSWSGLGAGLQVEWDITGQVQTLAWDNGILYAGGGIDRSGETPLRYVAAWNGSEWSSVGEGFNSGVNTLAIDAEGRLFAGGYFEWSGTTRVDFIAQWDGSRWQPLGSGMQGTGVTSMGVDSTGALWVMGDFYAAGGIASSGVARWIPGIATGGGPGDEHPGVSRFTLYPNPSRDVVQFEFALVSEGGFTVSVYDILGRLRKRIYEGTASSGTNIQLPISLNDLPGGTYFIRVDGEGVAASFPVLHIP